MKKYTIVFIALFCFTTVAQSKETQAEAVFETCKEKLVVFYSIRQNMINSQLQTELLYTFYTNSIVEKRDKLFSTAISELVYTTNLSLLDIITMNRETIKYLMSQEENRLRKECPIKK